MVKVSRTPNGAYRLRSLKTPRPIGVRVDGESQPKAVRDRSGWTTVAAILDHWRLDDEWWRERPARRWYYTIALADARTLTVYCDRIADRWYVQGYGTIAP